MESRFSPEEIDLAAIAVLLRQKCGPSVEGPVMGRTRLRDEVVRHLGCSQLQGEAVIDTMIGRGFLVRTERPGGSIDWVIARP